MSAATVARRVWAGVGQAIESAAIAALGIVVCALVVLAVWGFDQGFGGDPLLQWRTAVDAWLLGHGVDIGVTLGRDAVIAVGIEEAGASFVLSLGAWGIGLVTCWLHWRSGRRIAHQPPIDAAIAVVLGTATTGVIGLLAAASAQHPNAAPNLAHAALFPALVALVGMLGAILATRGHDWLRAIAAALTLEEQWLRPIRAALRAGLAGAVGVLGVGALLVGVGIFLRFTDGLLLLESLGVTAVGVIVVTLVQLAFAPVAIVWGAAWAIGPGFMIGRGSSVSPLDTSLGPVPAMPLLSAIDPDAQPWMAMVVVLPVLAAVLVGVFARQSVLAGSEREPVHWWELAIAAVGGGVLAGLLLGAAAMLTTGAIGPGRLDTTGPDAVLVAAWGALEVAVGLGIGLIAGGRAAGAGALAGGFAVPLALEREGSRIRDVLGFGRASAESDAALTADDEPVDDPDDDAADSAAADAGDSAPADPDAVDPRAAAGVDEVEPEAESEIEPAIAHETEPVVLLSTEHQRATQPVEPAHAAQPPHPTRDQEHGDEHDDDHAEADRDPR